MLCLEGGVYLVGWGQRSSYDFLGGAERREKEFTAFVDEDFSLLIEAMKSERQKSIAALEGAKSVMGKNDRATGCCLPLFSGFSTYPD